MKYIIEIEDEPYMREDGVNYYTCKSARWYKLSETIINRLIPYTEPDRKAIEDEVWKFYQTISNMKIHEQESVFGTSSWWKIANKYTYQEAKAKFEAWLKQKDEIHVGDEVEYKGITNRVVVVTEIDNDMFDGVDVDGIVYTNRSVKHWKKTGRHFPEVADLLEKMRGEEE